MATAEDLRAAVARGDLAAVQRLLTQPPVLAAIRSFHDQLPDAAILSAVGTHFYYGPTFDVPCVLGRGEMFASLAAHHELEIARWLFTDAVSTELHRTLQFFFLETARVASRTGDTELLELVLTSRAFEDPLLDGVRIDALAVLLSDGLDFPDVLNVLIAHGADVTRRPVRHPPLLECAAISYRANPLERIARLLSLGAFPNDAGNAVHWAARLGAVEALRKMAELGIDVRGVDGHGYTALHMAVEDSGQDATVLLLLKELCLDADARANDGDTILACLVHAMPPREENEFIVDNWDQRYAAMLLEYGADTEVITSFSKATPLAVVASDRRVGFTRLLLDHGANPNAVTTDTHETVLQLVLKQGAKPFVPECWALLIEYGATA